MFVTLRIKLLGELATRNGNRLHYVLQLQRDKTFAQLMFIMRKKIKVLEAEALFFTFENQMIPNHYLIGSYGRRVLNIDLSVENAFGSWDKIYIRSSIKQLADNCFIATIFYKYYWWSEYEVSKYFVTKALAKEWVLNERTHGCLVEKDLKFGTPITNSTEEKTE
jgi:hypothetical protein